MQSIRNEFCKTGSDTENSKFEMTSKVNSCTIPISFIEPGPVSREDVDVLVGADCHSNTHVPEHHQIFPKYHVVIWKEVFKEDTTVYHYFEIGGVLKYLPYNDDFGPMSLSNIYMFCTILHEQFKRFPNKNIAMKINADSRVLANSVFLIGAYMIIKFSMSPEQVEPCFKTVVENHAIATFRDACNGPQTFDLFVRDCWAGIWRARSLNWFNFDNNGFDAYEYEHNSSPLNGSVHEIVPGKFLAFRGPMDLPAGKTWEDVYGANRALVCREFSPAYFVEILKSYNAQVDPRARCPGCISGAPGPRSRRPDLPDRRAGERRARHGALRHGPAVPDR